MNQRDRQVLAGLRLDWTPNQQDVWAAPHAHVEELHREITDEVLATFGRAMESKASNPVGVVVEGRHGSGKTHLMCWVREQVQRRGGYFILMGLPQGHDFWGNLAHSFLRGLRQAGAYPQPQLVVLLDRLAERAGLTGAWRAQICGQRRLRSATLDEFVGAIRRIEPELGRDCQHTCVPWRCWLRRTLPSRMWGRPTSGRIRSWRPSWRNGASPRSSVRRNESPKTCQG